VLSLWNPVVSGKGSVGGGEAGEKTKTTPDEGGKFMSEKSHVPAVACDLSSSSGDVTFLLKKREHMICEFQNQNILDYEVKTVSVLKQVDDRIKTMNEKNDSTSLDGRAAKTETGAQLLLHNRSNQHAKASGRTLSLGGSQI
jgi:hypothetical protein